MNILYKNQMELDNLFLGDQKAWLAAKDPNCTVYDNVNYRGQITISFHVEVYKWNDGTFRDQEDPNFNLPY